MMTATRAIVALSLIFCNVAIAAEPMVTVPQLVLPDGPVTRAQFVQIVVEQLYPMAVADDCFKKLSPSDYTLLFSDVSIQESYAPSLCFAMKAGIVRGYPDGSFRPDRMVNFAESAKILARAFDLSSDVYGPQKGPWFRTSVLALEERGAIPTTIEGFSHRVTGAEAREMVSRLAAHDPTRAAISYDELQSREAILMTKQNS